MTERTGERAAEDRGRSYRGNKDSGPDWRITGHNCKKNTKDFRFGEFEFSRYENVI